jgi:amino acid transporter
MSNFNEPASKMDVDMEKNVMAHEYTLEDFDEMKNEIREAEPGHELHRDLKARHITMIAIGGALGTGLIIGSGSALATAGPAAIFIAYAFVGLIVYMVMCALGEMATWIPLADGFSGYASRFCDPALGFAVGWTYFFKYIIVTPNQLTAGALVIQYWISRDKVNPGVWITVIFIIILLVNLFGVKFFGEFEFWLSSFKVITVIGLILLTLIIALGGGPDHDRRGFRYWKDPGAFKEYTKNGHIISGPEGRFVSWASVLVTAVFAYLGTELVGVTVGEAQNPRRNIPRAIKLTFYRIMIFYVLSVFLLGMCVAYNDKKLVFANKASTSASASPFVVAIENAGIKVLPQIINAAILLFIFSASNSDLYIATRTLYGLSVNGKAPEIFSRTNRMGVPYFALGFSSLFCALAYLNCASSSAKVFGYFVNVVSILGLLTWICILVTHIYFMKALKAQGIDRNTLVYKAPFQPYGSYISLCFCCLIALIKNFTAFVFEFDKTSFITGYIGIPVFLALLFGYKIIMKTKTFRSEEVDLYSFKDVIDREEELFLENQARERELHPPSRLGKIYENSIGLLF